MNEELKNKLIAALEAKGLGKGLADFITITDEAEIEGVVAKAIESLRPVEKTKEEKLKDKEVQAEIDRRVTEALKKRDGKTEDKTDTQPTDTPAWAQALIDQNKSLSDKIEAIETGKQIETKQQLAQKALQSSQLLPDSAKSKWLNRIDLNSETSFEDQVKGLETEYSELHQTIVDSTPLSGSVPISVGNNGKASEAEIDGIVSEFKI